MLAESPLPPFQSPEMVGKEKEQQEWKEARDERKRLSKKSKVLQLKEHARHILGVMYTGNKMVLEVWNKTTREDKMD